MQTQEKLKTILFEKHGKRTDNGKCAFCGKELLPNTYCDCNAALKINRYFKRANKKIIEIEEQKILNADDFKKSYRVKIPRLFEGMTFDDYNINNPGKEEKSRVLGSVKTYYYNACLNYLQGYNLLLLGKPGTGKTMLSSILATLLADDCFNIQFVNIVDLFEEIKDTFNNTGKIRTKQYIDRYKCADFLFIDDIDKKKTPTDYIKEVLYSIFNYRVENQLPSVISANSDLANLDKIFDEVIISRLVHNATVVMFTHGNERLK